MNRIDRIFAGHRSRGEKALMPFLTAGDPDLDTTARLLEVAEQSGASVCELGIAFSDPIADGPVIQASMAHALDGGAGPGRVLEMVSRIRPKLEMGLMAMVSYSIVYRLGVREFVRDAGQAGIDGFIFPDLPIEESGEARDAVGDAGLVCSFLIAPTTPADRAAEIARASSGFVYVLSRGGLTGEQTELPAGLGERIEGLRSVTDLPVAVGFGISNRDQVRQVVEVADAAIVGSAIMRRVASRRGDGPDAVVGEVREFMGDLGQGLVAGASL